MNILIIAAMSLYVASLNSGSNGNCYFIGDEKSAVLVDVGISCREVEKRMERLGLMLSKVKAIFVSHEHNDHVRGIPVLSKKYNLPVFITPNTLARCKGIREDLIRPFSSSEPIPIDELTVTAFAKWHDAVNPHSFVIKNQQVTVGVFTDIGAPCAEVKKYFRLCHAAFLEANYDEKMLAAGRYPVHLKERIRSNSGHLSNLQAVELFLAEGSAAMTHLFLSHLSKNNNTPEVVQELFRACAGETKTIIAPRHKETDVYHIRGGHQVDLSKRKTVRRPIVQQLSIW